MTEIPQSLLLHSIPLLNIITETADTIHHGTLSAFGQRAHERDILIANTGPNTATKTSQQEISEDAGCEAGEGTTRGEEEGDV